MKKIVVALAAWLLLLGAPVQAAPVPFTTPAHLVAGQPATISVDNTIPNWKVLVVMPGTDFTPTNGACYTHLRYSAGYLPRNVWACRDFTAPIRFSSPAVEPTDLVDQPHYWVPLGEVGFRHRWYQSRRLDAGLPHHHV